jgi:hypothetical protein
MTGSTAYGGTNGSVGNCVDVANSSSCHGVQASVGNLPQWFNYNSKDKGCLQSKPNMHAFIRRLSFSGFTAELHSLCDLQSFFGSISNHATPWIDSRTRSIAIHYSVYSVHSEVFAYNSLLFDVAPEGRVQVSFLPTNYSLCNEVVDCCS